MVGERERERRESSLPSLLHPTKYQLVAGREIENIEMITFERRQSNRRMIKLATAVKGEKVLIKTSTRSAFSLFLSRLVYTFLLFSNFIVIVSLFYAFIRP